MGRLRCFSADIILRYNSRNLNGNEEDSSEFIMGVKENIFWKETYTINEPLKDYPGNSIIAQEEMQFCLSCGWQNEEKTLPKNYFSLRVENIVAHEETEAWGKIENYLLHICRMLSLQLNIHNCNKQSFQPKVQWENDSLSWSVKPYEPYEGLLDKLSEPVEYVDQNGMKHICIQLQSKIEIKASTSCILYGYLEKNEFLSLLNLEIDEKLNFLIEEYFIALGSEIITSKFFHLFAIIEFIEKEYAGLAGANKLLSVENVNEMLQEIKGKLHSEADKSKQILSTLKGNLNRMTDIGRAKKLANILNRMKICSLEDCCNEVAIDKGSMQKLIDLRNHYFHGDSGKEDAKLLKIDIAVAELMEICLRVIQYKISDIQLQNEIDE